jgi:hypothetical protein
VSARPNVRGGHPLGLRDFVFDRLLHPVGPFAHQRRRLRVTGCKSESGKGLVDVCEVGLRLLDDAPEILEHTPSRVGQSIAPAQRTLMDVRRNHRCQFR